MMADMDPVDVNLLLTEAKDAFGSANADKLGQLVERLASALEQAMTLIAAQRDDLTASAVKVDALLKKLSEQSAEIVELKTRAGEQLATLAYLRAQVFGPKSEQLRYAADAAATSQADAQSNPAGEDSPADDVQEPTLDPAPALNIAVGSNTLPPQPDSPVSPATAANAIGQTAGPAAVAEGPPNSEPPPTGTSTADAASEAAAEAEKKAKKDRRRRARKLESDRRPKESKRTIFGPQVDHEIVRHLLPPGLQLPCPLCGDNVKSRGKSVESSEIDTVESTVVARTHHRDKASCGCGALSFVMPGPVRAVPNMIFSPGFAAKVLVDKFFAHLPLNRQTALLGQQGLKISRDRLITLVIGCWLAVEALVKRMREVNKTQTHQGCDESPVRVVVEGEKAQRFLWCLTSALAVTFQITPKRNKETARDVVGGGTGVLTSDRLAIYRKLFEDKAESGCLSHLRRYFWYALDTAPEAAMPVIELIGELYDVEADAKNRRLSHEQRQALRVEKSLPILKRLNDYLQATASMPRTPLAKAINYANNHWATLIFYVSDGAVEIDNNECERRLRLPKLGWANWKQPQSELGIEAVAGFYTIISTCALHGINPRRYLADVLTKLGTGWPASRLDELLPWNWQDDSAVYGPPAPHRRNVIHAAAEIIELARVRTRVKAARCKAAAAS